MTKAMPFLRKYDITFLRPPPFPAGRLCLSTQAALLFVDAFLQGVIECFLSPSGRENSFANGLRRPALPGGAFFYASRAQYPAGAQSVEARYAPAPMIARATQKESAGHSRKISSDSAVPMNGETA